MRGQAAAPPHMNGNGNGAGPGYQQSPTGLPTPAHTPQPRGAYVPPGVRNGGPPSTAAADGGWGAPRARVEPRGGGGGFGGGGGSAPPGYGTWKNGHVVGQRNQRMELELFGEAGDGVHQVRLLGLRCKDQLIRRQPVSTLTSTPISPSRLPVPMSLNPLLFSPMLNPLSTPHFSTTLSLHDTRLLLPFRNTLSPLLLVDEISWLVPRLVPVKLPVSFSPS